MTPDETVNIATEETVSQTFSANHLVPSTVITSKCSAPLQMSQYSQHSFYTSKNLKCSLRVRQMHWNLLYIGLLLKHTKKSNPHVQFMPNRLLMYFYISSGISKNENTDSLRLLKRNVEASMFTTCANKILNFLRPPVFFFLLLKLEVKVVTLLMVKSFIFYWFPELVYIYIYIIW
jgi:hypothetical protein